MSEPAEVTLRPATPDDAAAIGELFLASFAATYPFPVAHPDDAVRAWLRDQLLPSREVWVAEEPDGTIAGFMALGPADIDQLYLAPDRRGRGIGDRLIATAKERRPNGLTLYTFQVNGPARRFYERHGFVPIAFGDGGHNEERQPDVRYAWHPGGRPWVATAPDGVAIVAFPWGSGGRPVVLVNGSTADHTTWRVSGPLIAADRAVHAIDRRGRGASGDAPAAVDYAIEAEYDDLVAVVERLAADHGGPIDVVGHSYGGRIALGAALRTDAIRRVVCYEGAPSPSEAAEGYRPSGVEARIADLIGRGERDVALATFFREIVRMPEPDLAAYRADPIWPVRVAAVHTTLRELAGEASPEAGLVALAAVRVPVLQVLGGASAAPFAEATAALDARLANGRVVVIEGARHAAHHSHTEAFVGAVRAFLDDPAVAD